MPLPFIIGGLMAIGSAIGGTAAAVGTAAAAGAAAVGGAAAAGAAAVGGAAAAAAGGAAAAGAAALGTAAATVGGAAAAVGGAAAAAGGAAAAAAGGAAATIGSAAAAAGGAALGAATTVGTAVGGAATAIGTGVTGAMTAVGTGVTGAMTAVGTGVGTVAGAASGLPVIGETAGAIAAAAETSATMVGAATLSTVGVANGVSGAVKLSEASDIKEEALAAYRSERARFDAAQERTNAALKSLGEDKLKIWQSFERFSTMYSKIKSSPTMDAKVDEESLTLSPDELEHIKAMALSAKDLLIGGAASVGTGALVGIAASSGSTFTGGAALMGGLTAAPALMVGGILLNWKAGKVLEDAKDIRYEADKAIRKMKKSESEMEKVRELSNNIQEELGRLNGIHDRLMYRMEALVSRETDYRRFTYEEKRTLEKTILSLKLLKKLSTQNILDPENKNQILEDEVESAVWRAKVRREQELAA